MFLADKKDGWGGGGVERLTMYRKSTLAKYGMFELILVSGLNPVPE